jgi:PiT family inorganic phosphate transporter
MNRLLNPLIGALLAGAVLCDPGSGSAWGGSVDLTLLSVIAVIALALLFDFSNGFHDAANSVATVVATRAMSARWAVAFSAACNFAAYFVVGTAVANTVAKIVKPGVAGVPVVFGALVGAIAWNYLTWYFGLPSSSSHALIGGLVGAGISAGGTSVISWDKVQQTALFIVVSPLVAFVIAGVATPLVIGLQKLTGWSDDAKPFKGLQLVSAAALSFGHGANDAQKTMGTIAALLAGAGYVTTSHGNVAVPEWVALSAYTAIAVGTMWGGWRIIETVGLRLTNLNARTAVAANVGAVTAIFGGTQLGIPLSTTHAATFSVVGAGAAARRGVGHKMIGGMVLAWVVTIPVTGAIGWGVYRLTQLPGPYAGVSVGVVVLAFLAAIGWAMRNSIGAKEVERQVKLAEELQISLIAAAPMTKLVDTTSVPVA